MFDKIDTGRYWDEGWKLVEGCDKVSPGCDNCWALDMDRRFKKGNVKVEYFESRLQKPLKRKKPTVYAIWNDLFHEDVPFEFIAKVYYQMAICYWHKFIVLTKRPERMLQFYEWLDKESIGYWSGKFAVLCEHLPTDERDYYIEPYLSYHSAMRKYYYSHLPEKPDKLGDAGLLVKFPLKNVWIGVTAENQEQADKRIPLLLKTPAAKRIVSVEPMLGNVSLTEYHKEEGGGTYSIWFDYLDWIICGGETGTKARPMHPDWVRSLRDQCKAADVPFCFKGWGQWLPYYESGKSDPVIMKRERKKDVAWIGVTGSRELGNSSNAFFEKVGKAKSGRLIDGKEYNEVPEVNNGN